MTDKIPSNPRQRLETLQQQRTKLFQLIQTLSSTPFMKPADLLDHEGFPLPNADLEVLKESKQRQRQLNEAQTDYKRVMQEIEGLLPFAFERKDDGDGVEEEEPRTCHPFALVTGVGEGTVVHKAGICVGDKIYRFGKLLNASFTSDAELVAAIREQQRASSPHRILLSVLRGDKMLSMSVECSSTASPLGMHLKAI